MQNRELAVGARVGIGATDRGSKLAYAQNVAPGNHWRISGLR